MKARSKAIPWMTYFLGALLIIFAHDVFANPVRSKIDLPQDCSYVDHDGAKTIVDQCADTITALGKAIQKSGIQSKFGCDEGADFPDLAMIANGENMWGDKFKFFPLGQGHFLIKLTCTSGAYNESDLIFAYDESKNKSPLPPLIVFPFKGGGFFSKNDFSVLVDMRDFDEKNRILYHYNKILGDGSGGEYAEYTINPQSFVPMLQKSISKNDPDHQEPYQYKRGQLPKGKDWKLHEKYLGAFGCIVRLNAASTAACTTTH